MKKMKTMQIIKRTFWGILGLGKELASVINRRGRDAENRRRFPKAIIDDGVCMTPDTMIGKHSHIYEKCIINHSKIGKYTYVSRNALIQNTVIGNYCSISNDLLCGLGNHPTDRFSTSPIFYNRNNPLKIGEYAKDRSFDDYKPIHIGNDVWIGARVTILDGVKIGNGAIIAAGSIVTKDVPPYAIVGGTPAKVIRYRSSEEKAAEYQSMSWWEKDPDEIIKIMLFPNE